MALRFFADHCVATSVGAQLREAGHEVLRLKGHLPTDAPDPLVLTTAGRLNAILLSLNGDFADIVSYPPSRYGGIIALQVRNHPESTAHVVARLKTYLADQPEAEHYVGKLLLVESHRIRIRQ